MRAAAADIRGRGGRGDREHGRQPVREPEGASGRWLPFLRLGTTLALTAAAVAMLAAAGAGRQLAGGILDVLRNVSGLVGIGLLCAVVLGAGLAWIGPTAYLLVGVYALYSDGHPRR